MMASVLLDTHALVWFTMGDHGRMPDPVIKLIGAAGTEPIVSLASLWEISIKVGLDKLCYPPIDDPDLPSRLREQGFTVRPIGFEEIQEVRNLPGHHRDPFDRILVAQAQLNGWRIISSDTKLDAYGIDRWWG